MQRELADCERRLAEQQDRWRWRERDLAAALEEARAAGQRLGDDKKNLEIRLSAASQEAADLKVRPQRRVGRVAIGRRGGVPMMVVVSGFRGEIFGWCVTVWWALFIFWCSRT